MWDSHFSQYSPVFYLHRIRYLKRNKSLLWKSSSDQPIGHFLVPPRIPVNHANQCHTLDFAAIRFVWFSHTIPNEYRRIFKLLYRSNSASSAVIWLSRIFIGVSIIKITRKNTRCRTVFGSSKANSQKLLQQAIFKEPTLDLRKWIRSTQPIWRMYILHSSLFLYKQQQTHGGSHKGNPP